MDGHRVSGNANGDGPRTAPPVIHAFPTTPGVTAFFTTRQGGFSAPPYDSLNLGYNTGDDVAVIDANWAALLRGHGLPGPRPVTPRLCHGAALLDADDPRAVAAGDGADAVFTRTRGRVIAVTTADCLAALVADPESGCVAAVHAGWRGTRGNILGLTLARLFAEGLCRPATTRVALGPCLSAAALELGDDVAATLPQAYVTRQDGRARFDLRACNRAQALEAGARAEHIAERGGCTRGEPALYFSHRGATADGSGVTGRLAACVALI